MALTLILTACLLGTTFAYYSHGGSIGNGGWGGGLVVSRREGGGAADVYQLVRDTLDKARGEPGILAADLSTAAGDVKAAADAYIDANGGEVAAEDVEAVIDDVASQFNGAVAVSALFDDPLTYEASVMDAALCLWNGLVEKAEAMEAAGQSPNAALAAISMTAEAIHGLVQNSEGIISYMSQHGNPTKRWEVSGGVSHGSGGTSYNVGISHKWGKRRLVRTLNKRGKWSGSVGAGYSSNGGASISGKVSYSWKR